MSHSWSVVITTRNRADMLKRAIDSCFRQTLPCEVIVVDEGSTDHTPQVVQSFSGIQYIRNEQPVGHAAAANLGIRAASGSWIKPLDDDDWLAENCIEQMDKGAAAGKRAGLDPVMISAPAIDVDAEERKIGGTRPFSSRPMVVRSNDMLRLMLEDRAAVGTPVQVGHSRQVALAVGGWNEQRQAAYRFGEEAEFLINLAASGDVVFLPECLSFRTMWSGNCHHRVPAEFRFQYNLYLKDMIAREMGIATPGRVKSYLALHWAFIAAKRKEFRQSVRLASRWVRRPDSVMTLLRRSRDASGIAVPLHPATEWTQESTAYSGFGTGTAAPCRSLLSAGTGSRSQT